MVKSIPGRRGGIHSRWARGGAILILVATLGWLLLTAGQVQDRKQGCILGENAIFFVRLIPTSSRGGIDTLTRMSNDNDLMRETFY